MNRLKNEWQKLKDDPLDNISAGPINKDFYNWEANIIGPSNSVYQGAIFHLTLKIPENYPFKPPKIKFTTPIYHPNINKFGDINRNYHWWIVICQGHVQPPHELGLCPGMRSGIASDFAIAGHVQGDSPARSPKCRQGTRRYCQCLANHQWAGLYRGGDHDRDGVLLATLAEHARGNRGVFVGSLVLPAQGWSDGCLVGLWRLQFDSVSRSRNPSKSKWAAVVEENSKRERSIVEIWTI